MCLRRCSLSEDANEKGGAISGQLLMLIGSDMHKKRAGVQNITSCHLDEAALELFEFQAYFE